MTNGSPGSLLRDADFVRLKRHLISATGLAYYEDKDEDLAAQVIRRMDNLGLRQSCDYLTRLTDRDQGSTELDAVTTLLTIGETYFFRHHELFDALRDLVFPELIRRRAAVRRLRIWSAGCATGAEAYSLAILLGQRFRDELQGWDISILGTDINREFLNQASHGDFNEWAFRSVPEDFRQKHFVRRGALWRIRDEFRRNVSFQYHNLVQHRFPSLVNNLNSFDLILCRNVMIYFESTVVARLVAQFRESLVDGGWLVVGHVEPNVETYRSFQTVNVPGVVLYQKEATSETKCDFVPFRQADFEAPTRQTPAPPLNYTTAVTPLAPGLREPRVACAAPLDLSAIHALMDLGNWEAAHDGCRQLASAEHLNPRFHFYEALIAEHTGRHRDSADSLKRAIYLDRTFVLAHYYLGLLQQRAGDSTALRSFQNVLTLLTERGASEVVPDADGLTVSELQQLSRMQLDLLNPT